MGRSVQEIRRELEEAEAAEKGKSKSARERREEYLEKKRGAAQPVVADGGGLRYNAEKLPVHKMHPAEFQRLVSSSIDEEFSVNAKAAIKDMVDRLSEWRMNRGKDSRSLLVSMCEEAVSMVALMGYEVKDLTLRVDLLPVEPVVALMDKELRPDHVTAMVSASAVYAFGAKKYADRNWERGMSWDEGVAASLGRHLLSISLGELEDAESGLPHSFHLMFNAFALLTFESREIGADDRRQWDRKPFRSGDEGNPKGRGSDVASAPKDTRGNSDNSGKKMRRLP